MHIYIKQMLRLILRRRKASKHEAVDNVNTSVDYDNTKAKQFFKDSISFFIK